MEPGRNNLDKASSPYLLQHSENPVWWQEWSKEVVEYAEGNDMPLFVSSGYSTCHWCHVMASEAFSDKETAGFLNEHFICIKIDREQRPDIDQYLMDFINNQQGGGGWPLNVFLTSNLRPVFALTYAPAVSHGSYPSFLSIAKKVFEYINESKAEIPEFLPVTHLPAISDQSELIDTISRYFDPINGGFGNGQKFPSHSTILFLLFFLAVEENTILRKICIKTLDVMMQRGLNDHLQGGIFRYCVDRGWTIPHFEKMLYDQAMALWVYSLAFRVLGNISYKAMAEDIIRCLFDSFSEKGFFISAHDADTGHEEGGTYLWSYNELEQVLTPGEFAAFLSVYVIEKEGNFEGKNHLIKKSQKFLPEIERKLLSIRKARRQPSKDSKILCGINALTAVAFIQAGRNLDNPELEEKGAELVQNILREFWDDRKLGHSLSNGVTQNQSFLFDAAALLLAITMLYENDKAWGELMDKMLSYVNSFRDNDRWIESRAEDFPIVEGSLFDHPVPSGISLAVMGISRASILTTDKSDPLEYRQPLQADFYNIACMLSNGLFHIYTSKELIRWNQIAANSLQKRGEPETDCYKGVCRPI